jgi:hypothetical protein
MPDIAVCCWEATLAWSPTHELNFAVREGFMMGDGFTDNLLIGHLHDLEVFHWFIRSQLESASGRSRNHEAQRGSRPRA